jgi:hypothetical protein
MNRDEMTQKISSVGDYIIFTGLEEAIVGIAYGDNLVPKIVYDEDKIIGILMRDGMTEEEAEEWYSFNVAGTKITGCEVLYMRKYSHAELIEMCNPPDDEDNYDGYM